MEEIIYVDEYLIGDDDLPVCMKLDSDSWGADFLKQLGQEEQEVADEEKDEGGDEMDVKPLLQNSRISKRQ